MEQRTAATGAPDLEAVEFVRFCYRRRRVGWPELYDEMCAVAGRSLYNGFDADDLSAIGIGFALFDMPALADLTRRIVTEEQALRRPVAVLIRAESDQMVVVETATRAVVADAVSMSPATNSSDSEPADDRLVRLRVAPAPA